MPIDIRGWLLAEDGSPIDGATVELFASGTLGSPTTSAAATTSTESTTGRWAVENLADAVYDSKITSGAQVRHWKGATSPQFFDLNLQGHGYLADGSAALPALQFTNDADTGLYRVGADTIGIAVGGTLAAAVGTLGLGVGVIPAARLHVQEWTLGNEVLRLTSLATNDDPTESVYQNRVATTDATVTTIHTVTIPASTTVAIEATVVARRTGGASGTADDGAFYIKAATFKNLSGTATIIGSATALVEKESQAGWDVTFNPSSGTVQIQVTGAAGNNVTWHITCRVWSVGS